MTTALIASDDEDPRKNEITKVIPLSYLQTLAVNACQSGMFKRFGNNPSSAFMVLQFGMDLGLSPTTALTSIHFIDGKPTMSGNLMWTLVKSDPAWSKSKVVERTDKTCRIHWFENGELQGESSFSWEDAKLAGLVDRNQSNYKKYPRAMLFNRAVSEGFKVFTPHLARGYTIYTPDEMGATINESGEVDEASFKVVAPTSTLGNPPGDRLKKLLEQSGMTLAQAAAALDVDPKDLEEPTESELQILENLVKKKMETL